MANIIKSPYATIRSNDYPFIMRVDAEFERARNADHDNRERNYHNWRNYFAVDGGQWPEEDILKLNDINRHAAQFNVIGPKVDTMAGELLSEKYDHDFKPIEGERNTLTEGAQSSWYADKELCRYHEQINQVVKDGLIYAGDLKMIMSFKFNPMGNIYFKRVAPGYLVRDPYWISDDDSECKQCWEIFHFDAIEIKRRWDVSSPIIDQACQMLKDFGGQYEDPDKNYNAKIQLQTIGHLYRVIEYHWMEDVKTTRIVGQRLDSDRWVPFPITEDRERLRHFMMQNKIDPNTMIAGDYEDKIHKFAIVSPQVSNTKVLQHGVSKIQCQQLPYIHFTTNRAPWGQDKGVVDDIVDIQETINKRESKLTDLVSTATGGGKLVNKDLFKTADERSEFMRRANDPSYVGWVDGEELTDNKAMHYLNTNQYPSTLINQLERMWDVVDRVSKVPASMSARSESANESGKLHAQKMAVARLANVLVFDRLKAFRRKVGEVYLLQWPWAYKGARREFATRDGKHKTTLNERVYRPDEERWYIRNRPDQIPRCAVIVTEKPSSPSIAMAKQAKFGEYYNLAVDAKQIEYANFLFGEILRTEEFDDEANAELELLRMMNKARNFARIETEIKNLTASGSQAQLAGTQAEQALKQLMQQAQPMQQQKPVPISEIPEEEVAPIELQPEAQPGLQP